MHPLTTQEQGPTKGASCPPTAIGQVPLKPLPQVLGKAVFRPPGPGVPGRRVSPHVSMGRVTCPLLWGAVLGAAQPYGVSLTTEGIAPASLQYDRLTPVARVAGPRCLAGHPLLGCVRARLLSVASMVLGGVYHGPRCSLAGLGPVALEYRACHGPGCHWHQPTATNYFAPPAPRESTSFTESGGLSTRHGVRLP